MQKNEINETISQLKPIHWVLLETKDGLRKRGKFLSADKEFLYLHEQRVMATGLIFEGKTGQVPQMFRNKIALADIATLERTSANGTATGSKITKK